MELIYLKKVYERIISRGDSLRNKSLEELSSLYSSRKNIGGLDLDVVNHRIKFLENELRIINCDEEYSKKVIKEIVDSL